MENLLGQIDRIGLCKSSHEKHANDVLCMKCRLPLITSYQKTHLKGLTQAKIIKKSVILFWLLSMTI